MCSYKVMRGRGGEENGLMRVVSSGEWMTRAAAAALVATNLAHNNVVDAVYIKKASDRGIG